LGGGAFVKSSALVFLFSSSPGCFFPAEIEKVVDQIKGDVPKVEWDFEGIHYFDNGPLTVQYLFVLDALNFCFWPGISSGTKKAITSSEHVKIRMKC